MAFLYTGRVRSTRTCAELGRAEPGVAEIFGEADRVMAPLLDGRRLTDYLFVDPDDAAAMAAGRPGTASHGDHPAGGARRRPSPCPCSCRRVGFRPDFVMGHSLGEYGALVASGALPFERCALAAVSARGREMADLEVEDKGLMAAVFAPLAEIERIVDAVDGNVVIANINSTEPGRDRRGHRRRSSRRWPTSQAAGHHAVLLPVSHAFHTSIVAPGPEPLRPTLAGSGWLPRGSRSWPT